MMSGPKKQPEVSTPEPLPPAPARSDSETAALAAQQRLKFVRRGGRSISILTGGKGSGTGSAVARFLGGSGGF